MADVKNLLKGMKKNYDLARKTAMDEDLEEGQFVGRLSSTKLYNKPGTEKVSLMRSFTVLEGESKGMQQTDFMGLIHEVSLSYAMRFIEVMGFEIPEEPEEWAEIVEALNEEKPVCQFEVKHNGDFVNITVTEVLENYEDEEDEEEEEEEKPTKKKKKSSKKKKEETPSDEEGEEEGEEEDEVSYTLQDLRDIIKEEELDVKVPRGSSVDDILAEIEKARNEEEEGEEEGEEDLDELDSLNWNELKDLIKTESLGFRVLKKYSEDDLRGMIRKAREELPEQDDDDDDDEEEEGTSVAEYVAFAGNLGIPDEEVNDSMTVEQIREAILAYELDEEDLQEEDLKFVKDNDLGDLIA